MVQILRWGLIAAVVMVVAIWWLSRPQGLEAATLDGLTGDPVAGKQVFLAAGCASCHVAPDSDTQADGTDPVLAGGQRFPSPFGTFVAPNISSDPDHGVGGWSDFDLVNAIMSGVSPNGAHYFPAFPYDAYGKARPADILSLVAYMRGLPASDVPNRPHDVAFPFNIRRSLGLWKRLYVSRDWAVTVGPDLERGQYLVEALGHCGACHTPRDPLGGMEMDRWLAGAPDPSGKGRVPNITPGGLDWSERDIAAYLQSGFTPEYDTAGGHMVAVIDKLAQLPGEDRDAIAAYLKAVPAVADP